MKKEVNILIWIMTLPILVFGQGFVKVDTIPTTTDKFSKFINKEKIVTIESIDFTGNNKKDFIVTTKLDEDQYKVCEYWISSDFENIRQIDAYKDGIQIRKFINLDSDPELEIIDASGYEDGIDYTIQNLNLKSGELLTILYFNPIIETREKNYWGYPWNWTKLKIKSNGQIKVSLNHIIERDGEITIPEKQKIMPAIYFDGIPKQKVHVKEIQETEWLTINEIIKNSR